jgi:hypothetical protein
MNTSHFPLFTDTLVVSLCDLCYLGVIAAVIAIAIAAVIVVALTCSLAISRSFVVAVESFH